MLKNDKFRGNSNFTNTNVLIVTPKMCIFVISMLKKAFCIIQSNKLIKYLELSSSENDDQYSH